MKRLSEKVMQKIRVEDLKPVPKWHFDVRKFVSFVILIFFILVGIISAGLILQISSDLSIFELLRLPQETRIFIYSMPYLWMLLLILSFLAAVYIFIKYFYGYRYQMKYVMAIFFYLIFTSGATFYALGFSNRVESFIEHKIPAYSRINQAPETVWHEPESGLLYGKIEKDPQCADCYIITDDNNETWKIDQSGDEDDDNASTLSDISDTAENGPVKIYGQKTGDNKFRVKKIIKGKVKGSATQKGKNDNSKRKKNNLPGSNKSSDNKSIFLNQNK